MLLKNYQCIQEARINNSANFARCLSSYMEDMLNSYSSSGICNASRNLLRCRGSYYDAHCLEPSVIALCELYLSGYEQEAANCRLECPEGTKLFTTLTKLVSINFKNVFDQFRAVLIVFS